MQADPFPSLGQEEPLEKETATHSSILDWGIPWTEESGGLQFMGHKEPDTTYKLSHHHQFISPGCCNGSLLPAYAEPELSGNVGRLAAAVPSV